MFSFFPFILSLSDSFSLANFRRNYPGSGGIILGVLATLHVL